MSNRRTLMAAAAIVLALVAGIGVYMYASGRRPARRRRTRRSSTRSSRHSDIAKGTTGDESLQAGLVDARRRCAQGSVPPSVVTDLERCSTARSRPADRARSSSSPTPASSSAEDGWRRVRDRTIGEQDLVAVTVTVDADRGVANQIAPGDHVDIATDRDDAEGDAPTEYLLQNVKVLAVGAATAAQRRPVARPRRRSRAGGRPTRACSPSR